MRGTGRTTKLLKATPQGGAFVVQNKQMIRYIQGWIATSNRHRDDITVVSVDSLQHLRGFRPRPMVIDHCVTETMHLVSPEDSEEFLIALSMAPYVIKCDEDGDVVTIWNSHDKS